MSFGARRPRRIAAATTTAGAAAAALLSSSSWIACHGFTINNSNAARIHARPLGIYAPPGSGYVCAPDDATYEDEEDSSSSSLELTASDLAQISPPAFPSTYVPMLEYPGTMRPGRTPENMPYHDLPNLGIDDPDPVPWPHFQEIEWHHHWDPPHPQALAMEEFIEVQGRWASVEEEAEMRMGMRRGVRERRESEELSGKGGGTSSGSQQMVIMDDGMDDEDEEEGGGENDGRGDIGIGLGDGVQALLQTAADNAAKGIGGDDESEDDEDEDGSDDFLLDLGLGGGEETEEAEEEEPSSKKEKTEAAATKEEGEGEDDDDAEDDLDLDFELGFDLDEEDDDDDDDDEGDEEKGEFENFAAEKKDITIDDYTKEEDGGDDEFDDGGFDDGD